VDDLVSEKSMEAKKKGLDASDLIKREKLYDRIIGLKIKKHRLDQHISIESLAQASGNTPQEMEAFESGRSPIPFMALLAVCHELGISYSEFISTQPELSASPSQPVQATEQIPASGPVLGLPGDLVEFVSKPVNLPFVELAQKMSEMDAKKLRQIAESILEITL
jgi:transcriptional regulator with XRE-family HTH domain